MNTIANYIKNVPELAEEYAELAAEIQKDIEKALVINRATTSKLLRQLEGTMEVSPKRKKFIDNLKDFFD